MIITKQHLTNFSARQEKAHAEPPKAHAETKHADAKTNHFPFKNKIQAIFS